MTSPQPAGSGRFRVAAETGLGIVLAAVPLALWVARSPSALLVVIGLGAVCAVLLVMISKSADADRDAAHAVHAAVPDRFVEELHRLFPLNYHHSRKGKPRFRRTMETLRQLIR